MSLSNFLLAAAFFVGVFGVYRSGRGVRSSIMPCLLLGILLVSFSWWIQPNPPLPGVRPQLEQNAKKPTLFSETDPHIKYLAKYHIPKNVGEQFSIGPCPSPPCFIVKLAEFKIDESPPKIVFSIGGNFDGVRGQNAIGVAVTLKEGCGFRFDSGHYDLVFEIINDRAAYLEAWVAVFPGTTNKGSFTINSVCPKED